MSKIFYIYESDGDDEWLVATTSRLHRGIKLASDLSALRPENEFWITSRSGGLPPFMAPDLDDVEGL
jgi:hypothetical protein